ncbi:MAG: copper resistance protein B [Gammaproteobacteria bacterium]|nr:copper resistance protein B [Gammaproteobacteria bacterium]
MRVTAPALSILGAILCTHTSVALADPQYPHHAQPMLFQFVAKHAELREGGGLSWDVHARAGSELQRLRLRSRGEHEHGRTSDGELEAGWQRAIGTWWDASLGWRGSGRPGPRRDWLAFGLHGMAPWFVNIDASLYMADAGHAELRVEALHELPLTQRAILTADFEVQANAHRDARRFSGSGLHGAELGLRLRYEFTRKFAPYAGLEAERRFGDSKELARGAGQTTHETRFVLGVTLWF